MGMLNGSGLRFLEALRLGLQELNFGQRQLTVPVARAAKIGALCCLGAAQQSGDLTSFATFMLAAIRSALEQAIQQQARSAPPGSEIGSEIGGAHPGRATASSRCRS